MSALKRRVHEAGADTQVCPYAGWRCCIYFSKTIIQSEVFSLDPFSRAITLSQEGRENMLPYDYLVFALGRRLAVEHIPGLAQHGRHPLTVGDALKFREAINGFDRGHAVIGYCPDSRLSVPVYETAFALDRALADLPEVPELAFITVPAPSVMTSRDNARIVACARCVWSRGDLPKLALKARRRLIAVTFCALATLCCAISRSAI